MSTTDLSIFSARNIPTFVCLPLKLHDNHLKPLLLVDPYIFVSWWENGWCSFALCIYYGVLTIKKGRAGNGLKDIPSTFLCDIRS